MFLSKGCVYPPRNLQWRNPASNLLLQISSPQLLTFFRNNCTANILPIHLVLDGKSRHILQTLVLCNNTINFHGTDPLAAFIDEFLDATC